MAERQGRVRVASDEVQGSGSFVVVRRLSYGQKRLATRMIARAAGGVLPTNIAQAEGLRIDDEYLEDNDHFTAKLLAENVLEWDWVGDDGTALTLPKDDPAVIEQLTDEEVEFLVRHINPKKDEAQEKN